MNDPTETFVLGDVLTLEKVHLLTCSVAFYAAKPHCLQTWHVNASLQSTTGPISAHQG